MNRIARFKPGEKVELGILRNGHEMSLSATIAERPQTRN